MTKVLMVEDDSSIVKVITELLKSRGFIVLWAPNVERAGEILNSRGCEVVLCDYHLPDGTALDVKRLKESIPGMEDIPFIIMTAAAENEIVVAAAEKGVRHFLCKPVTRTLLVKTIAKAMASVRG